MISLSRNVSRFIPHIAALVAAFMGMPRASAQEAEAVDANYRAGLPQLLSFENSLSAGVPDGWFGNGGTIAVDRKVFHHGQASVRFERDAQSKNGFTAITKAIPIDFSGGKLELRGYLRTSEVNGMVGLWMREDGSKRALQFDNMSSQQVSGTRDWKEYSITLPVDRHADKVLFGVLLAGTGTAWADDLQLLVDGKPIAEVAQVERPKTILDTDHEFDGGSGVRIDSLSAMQIDNLATLGRVWGFLKYHHPAITGGTKQWDFELFRVLPSVVNAETKAKSNQILADWIDRLGPLAECSACVTAPTAIQMMPRLQWIHDEKEIGEPLSQRLVRIYHNRVPDKQFYLELAPQVGNPDFGAELSYAGAKLPDAGYQLLALYRFWNIVEYWYPNRELIDQSWPSVLKASIPALALARDDHEYRYALFKLIAAVHDTHANLWSSINTLPPEGECQIAAAVRFVGQHAVVSQATSDAGSIRRGDVIVGIGGTPLTQLLDRWSPYYAASNEPTKLRDIGRNLLRGTCGKTTLDVDRDKKIIHLETQRVPTAQVKLGGGRTSHDLPGEAFRLLSPDVAYLKLSSVSADASRYVEAAASTKGLIVDIRNYPSQFVVFALGQLLVDRETPFVRFTKADLSNPGAFDWTDSLKLTPLAPHYGGKVIILVDEISQSQAEYTAMALRASPNAVVVGSTTAGADGNVSRIALPGNLETAISGIGVYYPDNRPTQRIGIVPDVRATPTVEGLRNGVDEVLEVGLRQIIGVKISDEALRKLYMKRDG